MTAVLEAAAASGTGRRAHLRRAATHVLLGNWTGASTVPSRALYPHQWSWDSAFVAIGLRHIAPRRAQRELETLLGAQWGDGRIPHIIFNPSVPLGAYFPSPDFWRSSATDRSAGAPSTVETSGIVQPPVHALAAWLVHLADPAESRRRGFLPRVYPGLAAWHRYLATSRDLGGGGLAAVVHPWEPGLDNSPSWDSALARVEPAPRGSFRRADLDHGSPADRPTDLDYARYVRLAATYRDHAYDDARTPHAFAVEDPGFNALLIASEHALAAIARVVGADEEAHRLRAGAATAALLDRLWDPAAGIFLPRDLVTDEPISGYGVSGLVPLIVPGLPEDVAAALVRTALGPRFRLGEVRLVPSYDLTAEEFDASRYWRGPSWFNMAWLVHRGLVRHDEAATAGRLRAQALDAAHRTGFAEYLDPYTGEGRGVRRFSWTAALALDLLNSSGDTFGNGDAFGNGASGGASHGAPEDHPREEYPRQGGVCRDASGGVPGGEGSAR
ncbi:trehalase family glycosidase [Streptosporangium sp. NPDC002721]|uniref:MGH1-like glycoside hydrolase domain-containing protein n=1 Tax=Streptosporangium sp. NPDC002721 TaxID=3366188 RepID=UPI0036C83F15